MPTVCEARYSSKFVFLVVFSAQVLQEACQTFQTTPTRRLSSSDLAWELYRVICCALSTIWALQKSDVNIVELSKRFQHCTVVYDHVAAEIPQLSQLFRLESWFELLGMPSSSLETEWRSDVLLLVMQGICGEQVGEIIVEDHADTVYLSVKDFSNAS